ncbi:MAG: hypothetical protein IKB34_01465 [Clostridia bacterium]|nr:hypothetical protein [Clostridia bacterium]
MRFKWFFLGYLLMFSIPIGEISILPVAGYGLMLYAMLRLSKYEKAFDAAKKVLYIALPIGAALLAVQIYITLAGESALPAAGILSSVIGWADELAEMAMMFFVYIGVRRMGDATEIKALVKHSSRNMAVMLVYLLTEVTLSLLYTALPSAFENFGIIMLYPFIIGFVWRVLNLWMIFTYFLGIADSREEAAAEKRASEKQNSAKHGRA